VSKSRSQERSSSLDAVVIWEIRPRPSNRPHVDESLCAARRRLPTAAHQGFAARRKQWPGRHPTIAAPFLSHPLRYEGTFSSSSASHLLAGHPGAIFDDIKLAARRAQSAAFHSQSQTTQTKLRFWAKAPPLRGLRVQIHDRDSEATLTNKEINMRSALYRRHHSHASPKRRGRDSANH
jgi:hypothetical protein